MTKRDFFRCFYPAWQRAFTTKTVNSSRLKTGLFPFNPGLVLDKLRPRSQKEPTPRGSSSSSSACWGSPSGMRKLRAIINKTVDQKTKKMMKRLSDDLQTSRAEASLERLGRQKAIEALRHEKKRRKRGRKLMEQSKAEEGSGAILFSPKKVRAALELQEQREQEKVEEKADKETRVQEIALAKIQKQQAVQRRREEKAIAQNARNAAEASRKTQRIADKEAKRAQKQAELVVQASNKGRRRTMKKNEAHPKSTPDDTSPKAQEAPIQPRSRSGRTIQRPAWLLTW
jgi:hypothetical protein